MLFKNIRTKTLPIDSLQIGYSEIKRTSEFKYLGIWLDEELTYMRYMPTKLSIKSHPEYGIY